MWRVTGIAIALILRDRSGINVCLTLVPFRIDPVLRHLIHHPEKAIQVSFRHMAAVSEFAVNARYKMAVVETGNSC